VKKNPRKGVKKFLKSGVHKQLELFPEDLFFIVLGYDRTFLSLCSLRGK